MKKFFVPAAIAALMGAGAWFGYTAATPADGLSDLQLANAEALADDPEIGADKIPCYSSAVRDDNFCYTDCSSCSRTEGWMGWGSQSFCTSVF